MIAQLKFLTLNLSSILNLILVVKSDTKFTLSKLLFLNPNKELIFFISFDSSLPLVCIDELDKIEGSHTAYLGINHFYLSKERVLAIIGQKKNLELRKSHAHSFLPIDVFVIEKK